MNVYTYPKIATYAVLIGLSRPSVVEEPAEASMMTVHQNRSADYRDPTVVLRNVSGSADPLVAMPLESLWPIHITKVYRSDGSLWVSSNHVHIRDAIDLRLVCRFTFLRWNGFTWNENWCAYNSDPSTLLGT